ncbi:MAG: hypothetical protein LPJ86_09595 [Caulobacteraceae bacterium]|nr:hypothetical protein [Caulobacteraceae bacterium]
MALRGLLPPSTNQAYRGAGVSAAFLGLCAAGSLVPGLIHYGLPDGGAGVIAGIDLTTRRDTIVALFAWYGALQIPHGLAQVAVALRYRTLVPLFLALVVLERGLVGLDGWFGRGAGGHHPPEHYTTVAQAALAMVFLILSLRTRKVATDDHPAPAAP